MTTGSKTNNEADTTYYVTDSGHPDWRRILSRDSALWQSVRAAAGDGPRVLIANAIGTDPGVANIEAVLAAALTLRGAKVHFLVCDEALPACWVSQLNYVAAEEFAASGPKSLCDRCFSGAYNVFEPLDLPIHRYTELLSEGDIQTSRQVAASVPASAIRDYRWDALAVGEHAYSGALRYYARGNLEGEPLGEVVLRRYFDAALRTVFAVRRLLDTYSFTCVATLHGIYVPEGLIGEVARERNVRVADWTLAYRKQTFIFSHGDTYHKSLLTEPVSTWQSVNWTRELDGQILDYLESRRYGTRDWVKFIEHPQEDLSVIGRELGIDISKPCVGLLTNVMWDAQVCYDDNAFPNMLDWVLETIRFFEKRSDLQLLIRVHPAELLGVPVSRQPIIDEIKRAFPALPSNVVLIPPESTVSTYSLMSMCNAVTIYATKTGIELAAMGIPVIVAGEAWLKNKGITLDATSAEHYFELLRGLPLDGRLSEEATLEAKKYAYHFFFRRMIPLSFMSPTGQLSVRSPHYAVKISSLEELSAGRDAGLDVICNGILSGSAFVYPAEHYVRIEDEERRMTDPDRALWNILAAETLEQAGELNRMRDHLIKTVKDYPSLVQHTEVRSLIPPPVCRLALASSSPIRTAHSFSSEIKTAANGNPELRAGVRHLQADIWRELAVVLWKAGNYAPAAFAACRAITYDPTQIARKTLLKRLVSAIGWS